MNPEAQMWLAGGAFLFLFLAGVALVLWVIDR